MIRKIFEFLFKKEVTTIKNITLVDEDKELFDIDSTYTVKRFGCVVRNDRYYEYAKSKNNKKERSISGFKLNQK